MSHEFETGFFVRDGAWHGLGNVLEAPPANIKDALRDSGLDWQVEQRKLFVGQGDEADEVETHVANVRSTDGAILGVVGRNFVPLQNVDAFGLFQPLIDKGLIELNAAIALRGGRRVCILAEVQDTRTEVLPGDEIRNYLLLAHGHDGSLGNRWGFTKTRTVCSNTLAIALSNSDLLNHKHTKNALVNLEAARELFDVQRAQMRVEASLFQDMARKQLDSNGALAYIREVFHEGAGTNEKIVVRCAERVLELFECGKGAQYGRGSVWNAFNAVTEYVTHERGKTAETRLESNWFGPGSQVLARAVTVAQAILNKG